jgi:cytochrome c oxidase cbb3-type subunit 3
MNRGILLVAVLVTTACGTPPVDSRVVPPDAITNFNVLYTENCSGCHGVDGKGGAAIGIGDPVYLAIADDTVITRVTADGVAGTSMPAFAQHSGGSLTDDQIHAIVSGIRTRWAKPDALHGAVAPPYAGSGPGDPKHGADVYDADCSSCHNKKANSILDGSYLTLVSDQNLRTTLIVGRPELGAPDWRGNAAGKPMSPEDVSDVVAWLASQRPQLTGQAYSSSGETQ